MARRRLSDEVIVGALLAEGSIKGAAASLGCVPRTLYERMKAESFKELYRSAKAETLRAVTAKLQDNIGIAVDTLKAVMMDAETAPQTRVNAAATILQNAARYTETADILSRLEEIEAQAARDY